MTRRDKLQGTLWFAAMMTFLIVMFGLAFFLTNWLFGVLDWHPSPLLTQIINSVGGLVLTVLTVSVLTRSIFRSRIEKGQMNAFMPLIDALRQMAKGDFSVRVNDIHDSRGSPERGIIGTLVETINQTASELNQMEQMRQEFISNVSHEIQSPLTSIRGFAQALQNDNLSLADRHHYLTIIETESMRLSKLTDNLLRLASLESDQIKFEPKPYRLDKQIRNLILLCEPQWAGKAIDMDVNLDEASITADEDLLSQVWLNLIHNGIKFTPQNGKICIELHPHPDKIEFSITDTGKGISEEDQAHIFERFYKADKSRTRSDTSGSGLGLSIAQKIIHMHKGSIAVESKADIGTTFRVSLPPQP